MLIKNFFFHLGFYNQFAIMGKVNHDNFRQTKGASHMPMNKKIIAMSMLSICATATTALANQDSAKLQDLQRQLNQLKTQIEQPPESTSQSAESSFSQHRGSDESLFALDSQYTPFAKLPSSQMPLAFLMQRNNYGDNRVIMGGYLEGVGQLWNGDKIGTAKPDGMGGHTQRTFNDGGGFALTNAKIYMATNIGHYVQGFMSMQGNQSGNVDVLEGFVTLGNLKESPFYMTFGKSRPSMGTYAGGAPFMSGLAQGMFRPGYITNATFGYQSNNDQMGQKGIQVSVFSPKSNGPAENDMKSADFTISGGYTDTIDNFSFGGILGYVYDWRGTGMAATANLDSQTIAGQGQLDRNGVVNFDGQLGYQYNNDLNYGLGFGGSMTTSEVFTGQNNDKGRAGAWYLSGQVVPKIAGRNTTFSVSYNRAYNTDRLPMGINANDPTQGWAILGAKEEYIASVTRPLFSDNLSTSLEYAHLDLQSGQSTNLVTLMVSAYI